MTKQSATEELICAIRAVAAGQAYLQPALAAWLMEDYRRLLLLAPSWTTEDQGNPGGRGLEALSEREVQVLQSVVDGFTTIETGKKLRISHKTVARHRERIMNKLDIHYNAELVKGAVRAGLIDVS